MQLLKHCLCLEHHTCCQGGLRASAEICRTPRAAGCLDHDGVNCLPLACNAEKELQISSYLWIATFSQETWDVRDKSHYQDRSHWWVFQTSFPSWAAALTEWFGLERDFKAHPSPTPTWPVWVLEPHLGSRKPNSSLCENTNPTPQSLLWVAAGGMEKLHKLLDLGIINPHLTSVLKKEYSPPWPQGLLLPRSLLF